MDKDTIPSRIVFNEENFEVSALKSLLVHIPHLLQSALNQYNMSEIELKIVRDAYAHLYRQRQALGLAK